MTPLPKLSPQSLETVKVIINMLEYSESVKEVMFNKKDISHLLKTKDEYRIDANKSVYLPNFAEVR